jgi:tetratricopeptide (TPR) repeat protein
MKKLILRLSIFLMLPFLSGCLAAFVPYTDDPLELSEYALHLSAVERPLAARRMLFMANEKLDINDYKLMAHFYRANAYMISTKEYQFYKSSHTDWNTELDGDLTKSKKLFEEAVNLFKGIESYYDISNTYWLLSNVYKKQGRHQEQCSAISKSLKFHLIGISKDPNKGKSLVLEDKKTPFDVFLKKLSKENNCENICKGSPGGIGLHIAKSNSSIVVEAGRISSAELAVRLG